MKMTSGSGRRLIGALLCLWLNAAASRAAEPPRVLWERALGGPDTEYGRCVKSTADGGYVVVGTRFSDASNGDDFYLVKTDALGNEVLANTYGGTDHEWVNCVLQSPDGGYVLCGWMIRFGFDWYGDAYLVQTTSDGVVQWARTYGGGDLEWGRWIEPTADGGYVIAGWWLDGEFGIESDFYLVKIDGTGSQQWARRLGGPGYDMGECVRVTPDGGYIIAGWTALPEHPNSTRDMFLVKTDADGVEQWQRSYGGAQNEQGRQVILTPDDGYLLVGWTSSMGAGESDIYLVKTDAAGNKVWERTFGGAANDSGCSGVAAADGGFVVVGYTESFGAGGEDGYVLKIDAGGTLLWEMTIGGAGNDVGYSIEPAHDGGYIIAGSTNSFGTGGYDIYLVKLAPEIPISRTARWPLYE